MDLELQTKITELLSPVVFDCIVAGEKQKANITHVEEGAIQTLYHITFSDGHRDEYIPFDDGHVEGFGRVRTPDAYEDAIFDDLCSMPQLDTERRFFYIPFDANGVNKEFNVWIHYTEEENLYEVYFKGYYQFSVRRKENGEWDVFTIRAIPNVIDKEVAALVTTHLDKALP